MKYVKLFEQFVVESRITHGKESVYDISNDTPTNFVDGLEIDPKSGSDVFFLNDDKTAIVTSRMSNLVYHGRDLPKGMNLNNVKYVYASPEESFYTPDDYVKLIKAVYRGNRATSLKPIPSSSIA